MRELTLFRLLTPRQAAHLRERFDRRVHHEPNTGCFLWGGALMPCGYGCLSIKDTTAMAHRVSLVLVGRIVPDGMFACHTCDVRWCVNPDHLYVGTVQQNINDALRRGRTARGERQGSAVLTAADVVAMREMRATGATSKAIGRAFGVSTAQAYRVVTGEDWKHVC